jgi:hypothetical protein
MELFYNGSTSYQFSYDRGAGAYKPYEVRASTINLNGNNSGGGVGLYVNSSNQVGINTTSPQATFDVQGTQVVGNAATLSGQITVYGQGSRGSFRAISGTGNKGYNLASNNYEFKIEQPGDVNYIRIRKDDSQTSEIMRIQGDGNVGIGIAPTYILDVTATSGSASDLFRVSSSTGATGLVVKNNGNVGIGTTTPAKTLQVFSSSGTAIRLTDTSINAQGIELYPTTGSAAHGFSIYDASAAATRFTINSNGNVGIGTTTPGAKLEVNGTAVVGANGGVRINITASGGVSEYYTEANPRWALSRDTNFGSSGNGPGILFGGSGGGTNSYIGQPGYDYSILAFFTNGTNERMRISSGGNVGIGTTTPLAALQVGATAGDYAQIFSNSDNGLIIGYGGSTRAQISTNAYGTFGSNYTTGNGEAGIS